jgi:hypothetical protein
MKAATTIADPESKKSLAARALELSQRAELLENEMFDPKLLRRNVARYRSMLAGQISDDERRIAKETAADAEALSENRIIVEDADDLRKLKPRNTLWCIYQNWLI